MLDAYVARMRRCSTVNQVNGVHIEMEVTMAPADISAIIDGTRETRASLPEASQRWLERMDTLLRGGGRPVQGYVRQSWSRGAHYYAAPGDAATRAGRRLVIAFSGNARRLMMPIPVFLQHCPADRLEFLLLMDFKRLFYLKGVEGLGTDLPSTIAAIAARFSRNRLRRAMSLGTSAGGLAAVWAGVELGCSRAISVGGVTPAEIGQRERTRDFDISGFEAAIRRNASRLPEVVSVSGERYERDNNKARSLQRYLPTRHITVPEGTQHNAMFDAWKAGMLDSLVEQMLGDSVQGTAPS